MAAVATSPASATQPVLVQLLEIRPDLVVREGAPLGTAPERSSAERAPMAESGKVLSPTQVRTFLNCSARWWFKYGLGEPETKTSALALGSAVHRTLEVNFREKVTTKEDLDTLGVVALFRSEWQGQMEQAEFRDDEDPAAIGKLGEQLVAKYMDEAAPWIQPVVVEMDVAGEIGGV